MRCAYKGTHLNTGYNSPHNMGIHATIFQPLGTCVTLYFLTILLYTYAYMACIYEALPHYGHELSSSCEKNHNKSE